MNLHADVFFFLLFPSSLFSFFGFSAALENERVLYARRLRRAFGRTLTKLQAERPRERPRAVLSTHE